MTVIRRAADHKAMPWANGRGVSYEVAREDHESGDWQWRLAIAPILEDGPFSKLPGVHRELTLIEGSGLMLTIDGETVKCPDGGILRFWGDTTTFATLTNGPVVDLNVMSHEGHEMAMMLTNGPGTTGAFVCVVALTNGLVKIEGEEVRLHSRDAIVGAGSGLELVNGRFAVVHPRR
jgi:environmental stress-induced protein Ves